MADYSAPEYRGAADYSAGDYKTSSPDERVIDQHSEDFQRTDPNSGVRRGLKTRHLSMLALAGIIGPGIEVKYDCRCAAKF
jgi:amino acid permease